MIKQIGRRQPGKYDDNSRGYEEVPNKWQDGRVFDIIEKSDVVAA